MSENLRHWERVDKPPKEVLKPILGGRLKGKSDINPQWRLKSMTELFGPVGFGWRYEVKKLWLEPSGVQVAAFAEIYLYYKENDVWSEAIPGVGGSMFVVQESSGLYTSDEAYKMAITDALSVAMKALGIAAEIYLGNFDGSKYADAKDNPLPNANASTAANTSMAANGRALSADQEKYFPRCKAALDKLYGDDVDQKKALIKRLTTFPNKEGKIIQGIEDYRKKDGQSLSILTRELEKIVAAETILVPESTDDIPW